MLSKTGLFSVLVAAESARWDEDMHMMHGCQQSQNIIVKSKSELLGGISSKQKGAFHSCWCNGCPLVPGV